MATWQVQAAKQRFSEVLRALESGEPQFITKHGSPVAVVVSIADFEATHSPRPSLLDALLAGPDLTSLPIPSRQDSSRSLPFQDER